MLSDLTDGAQAPLGMQAWHAANPSTKGPPGARQVGNRTMANQVGVSALHTTPYHSQTNGATERQHQVLERCLTHLVNAQHDDWSEHLQLVAMSMRGAHNRVIGMSPFEAMFGAPMQLPLGVTTYPADIDASARSGHVGDHVVALLEELSARRPDHEVADTLQVPHGEGLQPTHGPYARHPTPWATWLQSTIPSARTWARENGSTSAPARGWCWRTRDPAGTSFSTLNPTPT